MLKNILHHIKFIKMGNVVSNEEVNTLRKMIDLIDDLPFEILNIGMRNGYTGYLDFISPNELGSNVIMKGKDLHSRPFFVFKAFFEYSNGEKKNTFTTFFQRYDDDKNLWHCCGHHGENLMITEGGTNLEQFELLYKLFSSGEYKIDRKLIEKQRLNFKLNKNIECDNLTNDDYPIIIKLDN